MGQQQLLLLVLATVIVGLATVAGIQAFDENKAQATQDALVQRATTLATDIQGLTNKPQALGGVKPVKDLTASDKSKILDRLGYEDGKDAVHIKAPAAGGDPSTTGCKLITQDQKADSGTAMIECNAPDAPQTVQVVLDPSADDPISTQFK
jgi:hypothetical protein